MTSSCLSVTGELDLSLFGAGCDSAPVTGSLQVTGTWTVNPNGTYSDDTTTSGDEQFTLAPSCLVISSAPVTCDGAANLLTSIGFSSLRCTSVAGGGCTCSGTVKQTGGLGFVSLAPTTNGNYKTSGNVVTTDDATYSYCVSGDKMTMTPQSTSPTMTGTIVLQKAGGSGSGGTTGSGGRTGSGGTRASGGATGSGGAGGATGRGGSGGTTGSGGQTGSGGTSASGGATGSGGTSAGGTTGTKGPCDIYAAANTPCVAAHSTVRALYGAYTGKLYQVRRSDNTTKDILTLAAGGVADTAPQDTFCSGSTCVITVLYDQSGKGNDMWYQGSAEVPASTSSSPAKATTESLNVGGHKVYSLYINPGQLLLARRFQVGHGNRFPARGDVHGDQRQARQLGLLLRLRQQRNHPKRGWGRHHGFPQLQHDHGLGPGGRIRSVDHGRSRVGTLRRQPRRQQ